MKTTILLIAFLGIFTTSYAAISHGSYSDPNHPGKCAIKPDLILSPGDHKDPNSPCTRISCNADGSATFATCGIEGLPPGCTFGDYVDASRDYPDCCEKHKMCVL